MKKFSKNLIIPVLVISFVLIALGFVFTNSIAVRAFVSPAKINLGTTANFVVLAETWITNVPTSVITGNIGVSSATGAQIGVKCAEITGNIYTVDALAAYAGGPGGSADNTCVMAGPGANKTLVDNAVNDMVVTAYADATGRIPDETGRLAGNIGGETFTAGVYKWNTDVNLTNNITLSGSATDVWIFQMTGDLNVDSKGSILLGVKVLLTGGAKASNVFWQVGGGTGATLGTYSTFNGTILSAKQVILQTGAVLNGRALAQSQVTLDANTISIPTTLNLRKTVINDNGGTALNTAWTLTATGASGSPTNLSGTTPVDSGVTFKADTYTLAESAGPAGYTASTYSCVKNGGAAIISNSITLAAGDDATCTITNNDIAPRLTVTKVMVNDNNGTKMISDFSLFINGMSVTSGIASTTSVGLYTVSETSDSGYTSAITGNCAADGTITLALGDVKICTITNDDIAPPVGGSVVIVPRVPPLIEVVKVPSPLALPAGPGSVTYTYTLRNIGTVPVTNVTMVDDSCSPANLVSGDINADAKLDMTETWIYRCVTTLSKTHTNTVVATGWANNISATDIASATVVVGAPVVPPLIHVTKVPNPLALPVGGGIVTYTKKITNPGTVSLSNILVTDDKCNPINYISGDVNSDSKLDPNETWEYTCRSSLTKTTTNTAIVTGVANGLTARDFAIATVVVAATVPGVTTPAATVVPKLPDTGIAPEAEIIVWPIIVISILGGLFMFYIVRKKQTIY